jgi:hypothetical protein
MGQLATDSDYVTFQRSVNANVKGGARTRQEIMLRRLFRIAPDLADVFDPSIIAQSAFRGTSPPSETRSSSSLTS